MTTNHIIPQLRDESKLTAYYKLISSDAKHVPARHLMEIVVTTCAGTAVFELDMLFINNVIDTFPVGAFAGTTKLICQSPA